MWEQLLKTDEITESKIPHRASQNVFCFGKCQKRKALFGACVLAFVFGRSVQLHVTVVDDPASLLLSRHA